jgi:hypothetical protein
VTPYGFGEVRVATLILLTFTVLSGLRSSGVVIAKFSGHAATFRSSPTVFADSPVSGSTRPAFYPASYQELIGARQCFWPYIA